MKYTVFIVLGFPRSKNNQRRQRELGDETKGCDLPQLQMPSALRIAASEGRKGDKIVTATAAGGTGLVVGGAVVAATLLSSANKTEGQPKQGASRNPQCAFVCGLIAGVASAGMFNPVDRALYLSVKERRSFLMMENFRRPYQGFLQTVLTLTLTLTLSLSLSLSPTLTLSLSLTLTLSLSLSLSLP